MQSGELTAELLESSMWTDNMVTAAGIPVYDVPFINIGGGSYLFAVMVD